MKKIKLVIQLLVMIIPLIWIISKADFGKMQEDMMHVPLWIFPMTITLLVVRMALQSLRFSILTQPFTKELHFWKLFTTDMKAKYYSFVLPSSMGQDIVRGTLLSKYLSANTIIGISLFFRITGAIPLFILSIIGFFKFSTLSSLQSLFPYLLIITLLFTGGTISIYSSRISRQLFKLLSPILPKKLLHFGETVVDSIQNYKEYPLVLLQNIAFSFLTQILIIVFSITILKAITGTWYIVEGFSFVPVIEIISLLFPFSFNGAGVREFFYKLFLDFIGIDSNKALLFIAITSTLYLINLIGVFFIVGEKFAQIRKKRRA